MSRVRPCPDCGEWISGKHDCPMRCQGCRKLLDDPAEIMVRCCEDCADKPAPGPRKFLPVRQPGLPGIRPAPTLGLWMKWTPTRPGSRRRMTAAERRIAAARRDPRQASLYGDGHTAELTSK